MKLNERPVNNVAANFESPGSRWMRRLTAIVAESTSALVAVLVALIAFNAVAQVGVKGQAGARDRDFGSQVTGGQSGVYVFAAGTMTGAYRAGLQSNGLPVVIGICNANPNEDMCVARLNRDGWQLDNTFGSNGLTQFVLSGQDYPRTSAIDSHDRIIMAGSCNGVAPRACILRLNANGSIDTAFGTNGRGGVFGMLEINAMRLDSDGRMVVAGNCFAPSVYQMCVARLLADGSLDPSFNGGSLLIFGFPGAVYQSASDVAFDANGRILFSAYCSANFNNAQYGRFCAMRITAGGALDPGFNGGVGQLYALQSATTSCSSSGIAAQSDRRIIVVGVCDGTNGGVFSVSRLTESGAMDTSFGQDSYSGLSFQRIERELYLLDANVHVDGTDRILLGGSCQTGFCLARMLQNGRPDALFGDQGTWLYKPDVGFEVWQQYGRRTTLIDSNRLLVAGSCNRGSTDGRGCVTRHFIDTPPGQRCSLDLDGDGEINAATDAVLWARAHLGIRGYALTQGAIGARAQRTTPEAVITHLDTHCGIR